MTPPLPPPSTAFPNYKPRAVFQLNKLSKRDIQGHMDALTSDAQSFKPEEISKMCIPTIKALMESEEFGWLFNDPVDPVELGIPDYFEIITEPMDLSQIRKKVMCFQYKTLQQLEYDANLVFHNAILYNGKDSEIGQLAQRGLDTFLFLKNQHWTLNHYNNSDSNSNNNSSSNSNNNSNGNNNISNRKCRMCHRGMLAYPIAKFQCHGCQKDIPNTAKYYTGGKNDAYCADCHAIHDNSHHTLVTRLPPVQEAWVVCAQCGSHVHQVCALHWGNVKEYVCCCSPECCKADDNAVEDNDDTLYRVVDVLPEHCRLSQDVETQLRQSLLPTTDGTNNQNGAAAADQYHVRLMYAQAISDRRQDICMALYHTQHSIPIFAQTLYASEYRDSGRVFVSHIVHHKHTNDNDNNRGGGGVDQKKNSSSSLQLLTEYLKVLKQRGFHTVHFWCREDPSSSSGSSSESSIMSILQQCEKDGVVLDVSDAHDEYFGEGDSATNAGVATSMSSPCAMEGDFVTLQMEHLRATMQADNAGNNNNNEQAIMSQLKYCLSNPKVRAQLPVAHLRTAEYAASYRANNDIAPIPSIQNAMFVSPHHFAEYCQHNHLYHQDTVRRGKYATVVILRHVRNGKSIGELELWKARADKKLASTRQKCFEDLCNASRYYVDQGS